MMPTFFADGQSPMADILEGDADTGVFYRNTDELAALLGEQPDPAVIGSVFDGV